jgi:hypothetical protein
MTTAPICFADTETDGVHPDRKPWEIALVRREHMVGHGYELQMFVEIDLSTADPYGLKVGGFYDRHPLGRWLSSADQGFMPLYRVGPPPVPVSTLTGFDPEDPDASPPSYVTRELAAQLTARWTHGAHVVGAVPNFDTEVFARLLRESGLTPAHHYHLVDVETLMVGWLHGRYAKNPGGGVAGAACELPWSTEDLVRACGVEPSTEEERHTAMGDVLLVERVWDRIMGGQR